jgi:hypothetical protein
LFTDSYSWNEEAIHDLEVTHAVSRFRSVELLSLAFEKKYDLKK